jgi:hypothetical protein
MKTTGVQHGVASFVIAGLLLLQIAPAAASASERIRDQGTVKITFTKWRTAVVTPPAPEVQPRTLFEGFAGGDLGAGDFVAEVLDRRVSTPCTVFATPCTPGTTPPTITGPMVALHAIYEVQAGEHSFVALIDGGTNGATGAALLNGIVLAGWRTGAKVRVAFQTTTNCAGAPTTGTCFQGTITVGPDSED